MSSPHLQLIAELPVNDCQLPLEYHSEVLPLDVHYHILLLQLEFDTEGHSQIQLQQGLGPGVIGQVCPTAKVGLQFPFVFFILLSLLLLW